MDFGVKLMSDSSVRIIPTTARGKGLVQRLRDDGDFPGRVPGRLEGSHVICSIIEAYAWKVLVESAGLKFPEVGKALR